MNRLKLRYDEPLSNFGFNLNLRRSSEVVKLTGHDDTVDSCAWSPSGTRLASTSDDCTVRPATCHAPTGRPATCHAAGVHVGRLHGAPHDVHPTLNLSRICC